MGRKQKRFHYIYKTTNILSGKYYYGMHSTDNLEDGYLGSGRRLRYSLNKYGKNNHIREILEFCNSREELANRESELVTLNEIAKKDTGKGETNSQYGKCWVTNEVENKKIFRGDNIPEGWRLGRVSNLKGVSIKQSKLTEENVKFIRESLLNKTHSKKYLSELFKVSLNTIYRIKVFETWTWVQ